MPNKKTFYIDVTRLCPGLFVDIELPWTDHPFLFSKFKIKSKKDIAEIKSLGLDKVKVIVPKSEPKALKILAQPNSNDDNEETVEESDTSWDEKKKSLERAEKYRLEHRKTIQRYKEAQKRISNLARNLRMAPANAMIDSKEVVKDLKSLLDGQGSIAVSMVNLNSQEFSFQHHSLNVTVLSLLLGRSVGLNDEQLQNLGVAAALHDLGKVMLPAALLRKTAALTEHEQLTINTHVSHGVKMLNQIEQFPEEVIEVVAHHHAYLDGTGFPVDVKEEEISTLCRIVAIANHYDDMCNPLDVRKSLSPKVAMARIFSDYDGKLDSQLVHQFIRNFGVYPPGTVVELSDDSLAVVVSVDSDNLLSPRVLIYNPEIPPHQALMLDLSDHEDLKISRALKAGEYPDRVRDYLGLEERLGYFIQTPSKT